MSAVVDMLESQLPLSQVHTARFSVDRAPSGVPELMKAVASRQTLDASPLHCRIKHLPPEMVGIARTSVRSTEHEVIAPGKGGLLNRVQSKQDFGGWQ